MVVLNLIDTAYFPYTQKRSTTDIIDSIFNGNDFAQLYPTFLSENWLLIILLILLILLTELTYRSTDRLIQESRSRSFYLSNTLWMILGMSIIFIISRGGFKPRPIGILNAINYTSSENVPLILNTPFTLIKTVGLEGIETKDYYSKEKELTLFDPINSSQPAKILPDSTNVVIIILESFGMEFVGSISGKKTFSPFLDSMLRESVHYVHAFANGKKSVEALPAIIASLPSWMPEDYLSSTYSNNQINTLPKILTKNGYSSAFFHAATNGSMNFDGFTIVAGFDRYFGRTEYGNDDHYDGRWGISDAYFNPWAARKMSTIQEPFCNVLFTISSHHPYVVPQEFTRFTESGSQAICRSISYSDYALKLFFKEAKKQPWYNNTLFVFIADHSPGSKTPLYNSRTHMYRIPLGFYHPQGLLLPEKRSKIAQQLDILPTVLDYLNIEFTYYSFGKSLLQSNDGQAIAYLQGSYYHFIGDYMIVFYEDKAQKLFNFNVNKLPLVDSSKVYKSKIDVYEPILKAMIQRYSRDVTQNNTRVK